MTHDELLAKINKEIQPCGTHTHFECKSKEENLPWITLRAVVELHKPIMAFGDHVIICAECEKGAGNGLDYPCSTIQAIKKELK
jgi:hypothetical protein